MVNDSEAAFVALILAQVNPVSLHHAGSSVLSELDPLHVYIEVDTKYLRCIAGILTASIETEGATQFDPGRYQPVVGSQSGVGGIVIAGREDQTKAAVGLETNAVTVIEVLPAVAVTVLIQNNPVVHLSFVLKVPEQGLASLLSVVGRGACGSIPCLKRGAGQYINITLLNYLAIQSLSLNLGLLHLGVGNDFVVHTCRCAHGDSSCNQKYK